MAELEKLYSIDDAAKQLGGISKHTIVRWLTIHKIERTKVGGRTMIAESEIRRIQVPGGITPRPRTTGKVGRPKKMFENQATVVG